jgi:hypothetical protein
LEYGCSARKDLNPRHSDKNTRVTLKKGNLKVTFVNNKGCGDYHKAGYNGIGELCHTDQTKAPFVPFYAGSNLEQYLAGDSLIE